MLGRVIVRARAYCLGLLLATSSWAACNTYDAGLLVGSLAPQPPPEAGASNGASAGDAGEQSRLPVALKLLLPTTYSDAQGGKCSDASADQRCSDHLFCSVAGLSSSWAEYTCRFADLVQQGFGLPQAGLDPASVYSVQFTVSTKVSAVDLWIDDVSLIRK
jgi:hypothetical protein